MLHGLNLYSCAVEKIDKDAKTGVALRIPVKVERSIHVNVESQISTLVEADFSVASAVKVTKDAIEELGLRSGG